jgi:signal transduction histidine kinase
VTPPRGSLWVYAEGLAPAIIVWVVLVGWLASLLYQRAEWSDHTDEATVREWLDETRNFRKTLPELAREYARIRNEDLDGSSAATHRKRNEIEEHMRGLAEPTRTYLNQLPGFPVVYSIEIEFAGTPGAAERIAWESPLPRPRPGQQGQHRIRTLAYQPLRDEPSVSIRCDYHFHALYRVEEREAGRRRNSIVALAVLGAATVLAGLFVSRFLRRERQREVERLSALASAEHREREVLEVRLRQQEAELARDELDRRLLEQQLDAANLQKRADQAEKDALELKSQLYAGIGIMAGSYAHNIKNLLVRPNDLLARCIEGDGPSRDQAGMLREVRATLGTVTERLHQILRTVRHDPNRTELTQVDLTQLVRETVATWSQMAAEKWQLTLTADVPDKPMRINGDVSHLQQAVENLIFNARDATFEMRNQLRHEARREPPVDPAARRQRLIEAYDWRGVVRVTARREGATAVLEVHDNGIGMTEEVRQSCLKTHFTTKRDNALYEGYSAGMGLGLSFVAVVLDHHRGQIEIESVPQQGALFRLRFPLHEEPVEPASPS